MYSYKKYNKSSFDFTKPQAKKCVNNIGYEPADLTVHPPPPELPRVGSFSPYRCLVFTNKMSSRESLCFSELLRLKDQKTCFVQHTHSNPILIILTFLDNNE